MKKFLLRLLLFSIPVALFLIATEFFLRSLPNTYKYKESWMQAHCQEVSTLLLGNSHGYFALRPQFIGDSVFSLCNVSQRLEHDYFLLKRYTSMCPNIKRVVSVVDNSCLFDAPMEIEEPARITYYQLYMGYDVYPVLSKYGFELSNTQYAIEKIKTLIRNGGISCDSLGWGSDYKSEKRNPDNFKPENVRQHLFINDEYTSRNNRYMDSIASFCQRKNIELLFIQTPVTSSYTKKADPRQLLLVNSMIDSCSKVYGARAIDFSCDSRFSDTDFFDTDHLTDLGAEKFSIIIRGVLSPRSDN